MNVPPMSGTLPASRGQVLRQTLLEVLQGEEQVLVFLDVGPDEDRRSRLMRAVMRSTENGPSISLSR